MAGSCSSCLGPVLRIVVVQAHRLKKEECALGVAEGTSSSISDVCRSNNRTDNQANEDGQHDEVEYCITPDPSLSKLGLLHGVDGWSNLSTI